MEKVKNFITGGFGIIVLILIAFSIGAEWGESNAENRCNTMLENAVQETTDRLLQSCENALDDALAEFYDQF